MECVQRLKTALRTTRELFHTQPVTWDLHPGSELARYWLFISGAYSGLEQSLKYLIATEKNLTIATVRDTRTHEGPSARGADGSRPPRRRYPHHVHQLFEELDNGTKAVLREHYARFQSLHSYIPIECLDHFLSEVSGPKGSGYTRWRYALIEQGALPSNSAETLLTVWDTAVQICEERLWEGKRRVIGIEQHLIQQLAPLLDHALTTTSVNRQEAGEDYLDIGVEIRRCVRRFGHPLNFFAQCLFHCARYSGPFPRDASPWLEETLTRFLRELHAKPALSAATPLRQFCRRAQGLTADGLGLEWDPSAKRFVSLPWTLRARLTRQPPPGAIRVDAQEGTLLRLRPLLDAARALDMEVLENRSAPPNREADHWIRTLEVRARSAGAAPGQCLLSVWERRSVLELYLVPEVPEDQIDRTLRSIMTIWRNPPHVTWGEEDESLS